MSTRVKSIPYVVTLAFLSIIVCCRQKVPEIKADVVLWNGNIVTMDTPLPRAQAVAILGNHIVRVGNDKDVIKQCNK